MCAGHSLEPACSASPASKTTAHSKLPLWASQQCALTLADNAIGFIELLPRLSRHTHIRIGVTQSRLATH